MYSTVKVLPEIFGQFAGRIYNETVEASLTVSTSATGWISTFTAGVVTIVLGGDIKSWLASLISESENFTPKLEIPGGEKIPTNERGSEKETEQSGKPAMSGRIGRSGVLYLDTLGSKE